MSIKLDLTEDEVNLIINGLAKLPYIDVHQLIEGIAKVAKEQLSEPKLKRSKARVPLDGGSVVA
jgi:hypothetical protein